MTESRTIEYGGRRVPLIERVWDTAPPMPYRKTYQLQVGEQWPMAPTTANQNEHCVVIDGTVMPVGAAICRELLVDGAAWAYFTELWFNRLVLVGPDLVCVSKDGACGALIDRLKDANGGTIGGLPDVIGEHPDGRVILREAKKAGSGDKLRPNQHQFARSADALLGDRLDLAVVEWGRR